MFNFGEETQSVRFVIVGFTGRQRGTKICCCPCRTNQGNKLQYVASVGSG